MQRIIEWFLEGLAVVVPLGVTGYVCYWVFMAIDGLIPLPHRGLGVLVIICGITFLGFLASSFLAAWFFRLFDKVMARLPLVKLLYTSVKDLMLAFVGDKKTFDRPVAVSLFPSGGTRVLGFLTADDVSHLGLSDSVAVYFPQSYNFAGNLILVPHEQVEALEADAATVMTFLVSGGVSGKPEAEAEAA